MGLLKGLSALFKPTIITNKTDLFTINQDITIYPYGQDVTFIEEGYKKNYAVYSVVNKCVKKFSQVPFDHYKIKTTERKTWAEYSEFTRKGIYDDPKFIQELKKMRAKSVDQVLVTSPVSRILKKANRYQSGSKYRGNVYGHKLLTGEGNGWFARPLNDDGSPDMSKTPTEMFCIPKANLALVKGSDPWDIARYKLVNMPGEIPTAKDNILMWVFDTYGIDPLTLQHMRGQAPLDAGILTMQASNEGSKRLASMNKNQGAATVATREEAFRTPDGLPTLEQTGMMRRQFDSIVNSDDMVGKIAMLQGKWQFHQVGMDVRALGLLEQMEKALDIVCYIFDVPIGLFRHGTTYENKAQDKKDFIYDNIAPAAYEYRDLLSDKLIREFNLDKERDAIDCDILGLPEMAADQVKQAEFVEKMGPRLTLNEGRELLGWERSLDTNLDKHYVSSSLQTLDQLNTDLGGGLDDDINLLNE